MVTLLRCRHGAGLQDAARSPQLQPAAARGPRSLDSFFLEDRREDRAARVPLL